MGDLEQQIRLKEVEIELAKQQHQNLKLELKKLQVAIQKPRPISEKRLKATSKPLRLVAEKRRRSTGTTCALPGQAAEAEVLRVLASASGVLSSDEVQAQTSLSASYVRRTLVSLTCKGVIVRHLGRSSKGGHPWLYSKLEEAAP